MEYPIVIRPLSDEEGGGYMAAYPDLTGCMSDGDTPEEALANAKEALVEWMETNKRHGNDIPAPGSVFARAAEQKRLAMKAVKELSEAFHDVDDRIERVEGDLADLREQIEHAASWQRFSEITGAKPDGTLDEPRRIGIC